MKLFTDAIEKRTEDLKNNYALLEKRVIPGDDRSSKIERYFREIPVRVKRGEIYEAIFDLTRIATMLGEIRIEYRTEDEGEKQSPLYRRVRELEAESATMREMFENRNLEGR